MVCAAHCEDRARASVSGERDTLKKARSPAAAASRSFTRTLLARVRPRTEAAASRLRDCLNTEADGEWEADGEREAVAAAVAAGLGLVANNSDSALDSASRAHSGDCIMCGKRVWAYDSAVVQTTIYSER